MTIFKLIQEELLRHGINVVIKERQHVLDAVKKGGKEAILNFLTSGGHAETQEREKKELKKWLKW